MSDAEGAEGRIRFLRTLRAVRQFTAEPVPQGVLDDLLEVARWSGSSRNRQPWELLVIRERETLRALSGAGGYVGHLADAPLAIALVMAGESPEEEIYDEGRLSERIMLAAAAHGLGSCIGWFNEEGIQAAKRALNIPVGRRLRTIISIGYPAEREQRDRSGPARKPLAEIVHHERYG
jgi:nitroreductase